MERKLIVYLRLCTPSCSNDVAQMLITGSATTAEYFYTIGSVQLQHCIAPGGDYFRFQLCRAIKIAVVQC